MALVKSFLVSARVHMTSPLIANERKQQGRMSILFDKAALSSKVIIWNRRTCSDVDVCFCQIVIPVKCLWVAKLLWGKLHGGFCAWHKLAVERSANSVLCWSYKLVDSKQREPLQHQAKKGLLSRLEKAMRLDWRTVDHWPEAISTLAFLTCPKMFKILLLAFVVVSDL